MKFEDIKIWWNRQGNIFRRRIRKEPITVQTLAELLFMAAAGGCSVLLAELYPGTSWTAKSAIVMYVDTDQRSGIEEKDKEQEWENQIGGESDGLYGTDEPTAEGEAEPENEPEDKPEDEPSGDSGQKDNVEEINNSGAIGNKDPMDSAIRLNMAFLFPEGSSDPMDSYAGQAYTALSERDSAWIAEIYGLSDRSPSSIAESLGRPLEPEVKAESWENVIVSFYDGDGRPISGYSNAREILSLASVYAYYNGITDKKSFISYADSLWRNSHRYDISISDVYYCDGACLETNGVNDGQMQSEYETSGYGASQKDTQPNISQESISQESISQEAISREDVSQAGNSDESPIDETFEADSTDVLLENANPLEAAKLFDLKYSTNTAESVNAASEETTAEMGTLELGTAEAGGSAPELTTPEDSTVNAESQETYTETSDVFSAETSAAVQKKCTGHIDLKVNAYITGLNGTKNLFTKDTIGNDESQWTERWRGWNPFCQLYAKGIEQLDWYKAYGLTFSTSMYIRNPLSASEISNYMRMLPEGTSEKRKKVIQQALLSVGCIPYYWGGKPSRAGFEGNGFGTIVSPDKNGRILRGLDCSGWISWVYWTALDQQLNYQSTAGLIAEGQPTERSSLQPGDLILRTGDDSHVYMFMTWAEDGSMYLIHETGGTTNNVMIGRYQLDWPYYRNLINEE